MSTKIRQIYAVSLSIVAAAILLLSALPLHAQNVDDFYFSSFHAEYELWRDDEGRSRKRVTETLVAEFPNFDQNKGLVRELPITLNGRPLSFELEALRRNGDPEPVYNTERSGDMKVISTGTDSFVRGTQEYEFVYSLRDVTEDFDEYQELFWNVNGLDWRQEFEEVSARVILADDIAEQFTGEVECFEGPEGSTDECDITDISDSAVELRSTRSLPAGENVSFAIKFEPDAFEPYAATVGQQYVRYGLAGLAVLLSGLGVVGAVRVYRRYRDSSRHVVAREYIPPKDISVLKAAMIYKKPKAQQKAVTSQLLELAVQRKIKIIETEQPGFLGRTSKAYAIEVVSTRGLSKEANRLLSILYGGEPKVGKRKDIASNNTKVASELGKFQRQLEKDLVKQGYREARPTTWHLFTLTFFGFGSGMAFFIYSSEIGYRFQVSDPLYWSFPLAILFGFSTIVLLANHLKRLTEKGQKLIDHIRGLDEYISLAEAERLRFHQSPEGARRQRINSDNKEEILRLYERLLPYAVTLGHEKQWYNVIGRYYEEVKQSPAWYAGTGAFNASQFSSSMSSLSNTATSTTGSGFSGGGGSGGGGGGGGGGGR